MSESDPKLIEQERGPAALSSEYHKAHKQVMLWATILLIWELIGVDLSKAKDAGGNIGPIITALKSPQAVPWALTGLIVYFLFKCSVEWAQSDPTRRKMRFARIDFISAWVVSIGAIALYVGQAVGRVQFADLLGSPHTGKSLLLGLIVGFTFTGGLSVLLKRRSTKRTDWLGPGPAMMTGAVVSIPIIIGIERYRGNFLRFSFLLLGLLISGSATLFFLLMRFLTPRWGNIKASLPKK